MQPIHRYFIINKPRDMVSQFISPHKVRLLGDLAFDFPEGTHAVGRLDNDSEGLLILTTNKKVTRLLFRGVRPHKRTYLVQVNNMLSSDSLEQLRSGVVIPTGPGMHYTTPACEVAIGLSHRTCTLSPYKKNGGTIPGYSSALPKENTGRCVK